MGRGRIKIWWKNDFTLESTDRSSSLHLSAAGQGVRWLPELRLGSTGKAGRKEERIIWTKGSES